MTAPVSTAIGAQRRFTLAVVAALVLPGVAGCGRKAARPRTEREITWQGLRLGDGSARFEAVVKKLGWKSTCRVADSVTFLEGQTQHTRWVKKAARERLRLCRGEPEPKPADDVQGEIGARVYLLDDRIVRLNVITQGTDADFQRALVKRFGDLATETIAVRLYKVERSGKMRTWTVRRPGAALLWMRGAKVQEIQVLPTDERTLAALRAVAAERRGE
jgi:hypothetical protein